MSEVLRRDLEAHLRGHVEYLAGALEERNPRWYANLEKARRYIERMFVDAGYDIRHDVYEVSGRTYYNVIAEAPATNGADELLLVGAHYDTAAGTPGADDNASGVATLLELARLLREVSPRLTLRWVAFTLEEPPSFGRRTWAAGFMPEVPSARRTDRGHDLFGDGGILSGRAAIAGLSAFAHALVLPRPRQLHRSGR